MPDPLPSSIFVAEPVPDLTLLAARPTWFAARCLHSRSWRSWVSVVEVSLGVGLVFGFLVTSVVLISSLFFFGSLATSSDSPVVFGGATSLIVSFVGGAGGAGVGRTTGAGGAGVGAGGRLPGELPGLAKGCSISIDG